MLRIAVVGSGPSGVYTAQALTEGDPGPAGPVAVDVLDRLPCPYGLVRYGVAPDHEKIKSLQGSLRQVLERPGVRFLGHVPVGADGVSTALLARLYHAVVYCVGASADRRLGIPGEDLRGSRSATEFVSWYSAHPDAAEREFALGSRGAVVIGLGNVAVDVTRMLARGADRLRRTDMPQGPLSALTGSGVREIHLVGRRGPGQARFTARELRELGSLEGTGVEVEADELTADPGYRDPAALPGPARRNIAVLRSWADRSRQADRGRRIRLRFFLRPVEILDDGTGAVRGVRFERTVPDGRGGVRGTGVTEDIQAGLVLRSVGYRGVPLPGLPFDPASGTVPHRAGLVLRDGDGSPGAYVAGWIKRGPTGVIGTNRPCARETAATLLSDADSLSARPVSGADPLDAFRAAGLRPVAWHGWLGIEAAERELGGRLSRPAVKIPDWAGLLSAAGG